MSDQHTDQTEDDRVTGVSIVDGDLVFRRHDGTTLTYVPSPGGFVDGPVLGIALHADIVPSTDVEDFPVTTGTIPPFTEVILWAADAPMSSEIVDTVDLEALEPDGFQDVGDYRVYADMVEFLTAGIYSMSFAFTVGTPDPPPDALLKISAFGAGGQTTIPVRTYLSGITTMAVVAQNIPGGGVGGQLLFYILQAGGVDKVVDGMVYINRVA